MRRLRAFARQHSDLLVFVAVVAGLAFYLHVQTAHLNRESYNRCRDRDPNIAKANRYYMHMADLEARNRFIDQSLRDARVAAYRDMVLAPAHCGTP